MEAQRDADGGIVKYGFDTAGRVGSVEDMAGVTTQFVYNIGQQGSTGALGSVQEILHQNGTKVE